jgi:diguanylate cyclase (GGDEF)-like protein
MQGAPAQVAAAEGGMLRAALSRVFSRVATRVWTFTALLAATAVLVTVLGLRGRPAIGLLPHIPFPLLVVLMAASESFVVHIHYHRAAHSVTVRDVVVVLALTSVTPQELVLANALGGAISLVAHRRQTPLKLFFNVALFALDGAFTAFVFRTLVDGHDPTGPFAWAACMAAVMLGTAAATLMVVIVMGLAEGRLQLRRWTTMASFGLAGAFANASMGMAAAMLGAHDTRAALLLLPPGAVLFAAYRAYTGERTRKERVEQLYRSTHDLQKARDLAAGAASVLQHAAEMFRAEVAELTLFAIDSDGVALRARLCDGRMDPLQACPEAASDPVCTTTVASEGNLLVPRRGDHPLRAVLHARGMSDAAGTTLSGESGVFGTLVVGNRLGDVSTFDRGDLQLIRTLASHASLTLENRRLEQQLKHQAFHDDLTRLANRALLTNRIEHALNRRATDESVAVLYLDLDDFKLVNDGLGHSAGDRLLVAVAERLRACLRPFDTAARLGGDEFAVLIEDAHTADDAVRVAQRIEDALATPVCLDRQDVTVRASIGVVWAGSSPADAEELLRNADIAMYRAKAKGGGWELFERSMQVAVEERHGMKADLQRAMEQGGLCVHYQPVVQLSTGRTIAVEALLRWQHSDRGLLSPAEFVPLAEETGLIINIDQMVLRESLRQLRVWKHTLGSDAPAHVSVNVSSRALRDPDFPRRVLTDVHEAKVDPANLLLEITETVLLEDLDTACARLQHLRDAGVRIAIDDFGTGYSSLGYLRRLPVDVVKIDRTFVAGIETAGEERSLTLAIVRMLGMFDVEIIAEGIETGEQLAYVQAMGCDLGQGYGLARPLPGDAIGRLLRRRHSLVAAMAS